VTRRHAQITQADIDRAIRALKKAGLTNYEIAIEGPRIIIRVPGSPLVPDKPVAEAAGSWDTVVAELERQ
jgi:hypothetical protein